MPALPLDQKAALPKPPDVQLGKVGTAGFNIRKKIGILGERFDHRETLLLSAMIFWMAISTFWSAVSLIFLWQFETLQPAMTFRLVSEAHETGELKC